MAIVLFTDFGAADIYVGQVKAVLLQRAPGQPVVDLLHDAPAYNIRASAHLLAACAPRFPAGAVVLAVVDPGVGSERDAVVVQVDGRYFVGPDNGLLSVHASRAGIERCWSIVWRAEGASASFHGRDLFAPVAATIAAGDWPETWLAAKPRLAVDFGAEDSAEIIYIDHYGNACTGLRASRAGKTTELDVGGRRLARRCTFAEAGPDEPFWYENSLGLIEVALNMASAEAHLGLRIGDRVIVLHCTADRAASAP